MLNTGRKLMRRQIQSTDSVISTECFSASWITLTLHNFNDNEDTAKKFTTHVLLYENRWFRKKYKGCKIMRSMTLWVPLSIPALVHNISCDK